jgi:hypothetical protein
MNRISLFTRGVCIATLLGLRRRERKPMVCVE